MAIIQCPECGKNVSDAATVCPNCGFPIHKENADKPRRNKILLIIVVVIVLVAIAGAVVFFLTQTASKKSDGENSVSSAETSKTEEEASASSKAGSSEKEISVSSKEKLTPKEEKIFNLLIGNMEKFYAPSELRVIDIGDGLNFPPDEYFPEGQYTVVIKFNSGNLVGGTVSEVYSMYLEDGSFTSDDGHTQRWNAGDLEPYYSDDISRSMGENTIKRLNEAIKEYCSEMGLD